MPFTKHSATDDITRECLAGATPAELVRKGYPDKSSYRIYRQLEADGKLPGGPNYGKEDKEDDVDPFKLAEPSTRVRQIVPTKQQVQATTPGAKAATGVSEIDKIRGVVGIYDQPKVLYMERPELLYIAMAMSLHYWGWSQMSTADFIDTILDDYIRASGKEYNVIIDTGRLGELVSFAKERGFNFWDEKPVKEKVDTEGELPNEVKRLAEELEEQAEVKQETEEINVEGEDENGNNLASAGGIHVNTPNSNDMEPSSLFEEEKVLETTESNVEEKPYKPTVGDLLSRLHISNIQKEVEGNDSPEAA